MKYLVCSLCHNGVLGGALYFDSQSLSYKTNKLRFTHLCHLPFYQKDSGRLIKLYCLYEDKFLLI